MTIGWPPGPSLAERIFDGSLFATDSPSFFRNNAARYGDVVSFITPSGFRQFQFNHPDAIAEMLTFDAPHHLRGVVLRRARSILGDGLLTSEEPIHLRQRRLAAPAFHRQRIANYGTDIVSLTGGMASTWNSGAVIELHSSMTELALRIISRCLLGCEVQPSVRTFVSSMAVFNDYLPFALLPGAPLLERLPIGPMPRLRRALAALDQVIFEMIRERRERGVDGDDLLGMLLEAEDESGAMSAHQVRDEALTMLLAGHETTANALTFAVWLTARHIDVQQRMAAEIHEVCGDRPLQASDCSRLRYVEQVFSESMRLYPPAWVVARTAAQSYTMRSGQFIPKGSHLIASQLVVHHDPRWWPDPDRFDPLRFEDHARASRPKMAYFPFGGGARFCIGDRFAWMEGVLILATIVQSWRLTLPAPLDSLPIAPKFTIRPRDPVRIVVEFRGR